ncbi:ATP-dependent helicase [Hamadaea tsunoensis]|uniref:ATP-dependent helicase n=1 Tax=Hamadaea tsunoensis TaxID=53368 RepID=UPI0006877BF5|nr:ATP-dependent DNA helicase [Hamadaea tsunoensis]
MVRPAPDGDATAPPPVLDPAQAAVVAHRGGPLLVLGGPGTGKTTALVESVAARVTEGEDPERILVLTFGRRTSAELRRRIEARVSGASPRRVMREPVVRTFHAWAFGLLRSAAALRGEPAPRLLTGPEQDLLIRELLEDGEIAWPDGVRPALKTRAFAEQLRDLMQRAAERGLGPAGLDEVAARTGRADWHAAAEFLGEYEQILALSEMTTRSAAAYDPAELVRAASELLLRDPALLDGERRRLGHVYVDEYAEVDPAQVELLELVAGGGAPVIAFADPDSSTFGFRGADPGLTGAFPATFHQADGRAAPVLTLPVDHRGGAALSDAAARVAVRLRTPAGLGTGHRRAVPPAGGPTGHVEVVSLRSAAGEAAFVAHRLREAHLVDGIPWDRMAVILRSPAIRLASLHRGLRQAGVPAYVLGEDLALHEHPAVRPLLLLLRCALRPAELTEQTAIALLHSPLGGADPYSERKLRQGLRALAHAADDHRGSGELLVEALREPAELAVLDRHWAIPATRIATLLATAREAAARRNATAEDVLWAVWRASGLAERWSAVATAPAAGPDQQRRAEAADRDLDVVMVLFDAAARFTDRLPGAKIDTFLDHVEGQQLPLDSIAPHADRGAAVRLLTAHAAKGLEWDVVVVAGVQEGVWPDLRLRGSLLGSERLVDVLAERSGSTEREIVVAQSAALLDEERRLFHVAVTRARRRLLVTAVDSGAVGGDDGEERPSRFLFELAGGEVIPGEPEPEEAAELTVGRPPRALTLPALVAELRVAAMDPRQSEPRRKAAAEQLARLAREGVPGAHPDEWWGLPELSDERPLSDEGEVVTVTPSTMESALRCSLRWLLERHGGNAPDSYQQGVGNLVHAAAMLAEDAVVDRGALLNYVTERFEVIELAAKWLAPREQRRAEDMVDKLVRWLSDNPRRLIAIERDFLVRVTEDTAHPVDLKGRVDRLEVDADGRLVVIDLKTGNSTVATAAELPEHPQLGAYQVAVEAGAFPEGVESGGAALVQLGGDRKDAREQVQDALGVSGNPEWALEMVRRTGTTMAAATFVAKANDKCRVCPVRPSCPVSGKGRQVVSDE